MLARTDHDFVLSQPKAGGKSRRKPAQKPSRAMAVLRTMFRNPGRTIVGAAGTALSIAIVANAMMQNGPHPAPFFRPPVEVLRPAPLPPSRPVELSGRDTAQAADPTQAAGSRGVRATTPGNIVPQPTPRDPIADVLKAGTNPAPAASSTPVPDAGRIEPNRAVINAQRALNKLNYGPMKPDGLLGPGTKQAIERFERDHRLPVTGELAPRTLRELASASGIPQD